MSTKVHAIVVFMRGMFFRYPRIRSSSMEQILNKLEIVREASPPPKIDLLQSSASFTICTRSL